MNKNHLFLILGIIIILSALILRITDHALESPAAKTPSAIENDSASIPIDTIKDQVEVELFAPAPDEPLSSPYTVRGRAHGSWFFEAVLPVVLTDINGNVLDQTYGKAVGDWMFDGWVEFTSDLEFDAFGVESGYLIIKKDNPSGLPEHDAQVSFPVSLAE